MLDLLLLIVLFIMLVAVTIFAYDLLKLYDCIIFITLGISVYITKHRGTIMEKDLMNKYKKGKVAPTCILYVKLMDTGVTHKVEIDIKNHMKYSIDGMVSYNLYWLRKTNKLLGSNIESETTSILEDRCDYD